jgi:GntR family transcriptional regulator
MDFDQQLPSAQLNRSSKVPLYHQLYEILRGNIIDGHWPTGAMIPPESELCAFYRVSQITARQALDNLVGDGLIYRQRGRGTFVAQPAIETSLTRIISFTEDMRGRDYEPGSRVFFSRIVAATPAVAQKLSIEPGEELAQLDRLRFADGEPLSVERASLVHKLCPGVLDGDYESDSLRAALLSQYGLQLIRAEQSIRALGATEEVAELLSIKPGEPLLGIERISFSQHDVPVEWLQILYRSDRYVLHAELQG